METWQVILIVRPTYAKPPGKLLSPKVDALPAVVTGAAEAKTVCTTNHASTMLNTATMMNRGARPTHRRLSERTTCPPG
jgi:hypothetical protein